MFGFKVEPENINLSNVFSNINFADEKENPFGLALIPLCSSDDCTFLKD